MADTNNTTAGSTPPTSTVTWADESTILDYLWIDGGSDPRVRSKTKVLQKNPETFVGLSDIHHWGFDGSSTQQADGGDSDLGLVPVAKFPNPLRANSLIVMCEVSNSDHSGPHRTNVRAPLSALCRESHISSLEPWFAIEQEYTLIRMADGRPLGWPASADPAPQGDYYCGRNIGDIVIEEHLTACLEAGLSIGGTNAEVMLGQWEYQIGPSNPVNVSDELWVSRWLLEKIAAAHGVHVSWDPKPVQGDWNGAGAHTNFSTNDMRGTAGSPVNPGTCRMSMENALTALEQTHTDHIEVYGMGNEKRLTGMHETCKIDEFKWGVGDRTASVSVPKQVMLDGCGYIEDRRPAANMNPYLVCLKILETTCKS